jgi:hypothetical protein
VLLTRAPRPRRTNLTFTSSVGPDLASQCVSRDYRELLPFDPTRDWPAYFFPDPNFDLGQSLHGSTADTPPLTLISNPSLRKMLEGLSLGRNDWSRAWLERATAC